MARKAGYPVLLGITILFTVSGLITPFVVATRLPPAQAIVAIVAPFLLAGLTCIIRKKFFVEV